MILTVDIGNTTIGLCGLERENDDYRILFQLKTESRRELSSGEWRELFRQELDRTGFSGFAGAAVSSVVPRLTYAVEDAIGEITGAPVFRVTAGADSGLSFAVSHPERIGADRIADAAWAAFRYPQPVITVDMGTATTFNVIDGDVFLGGIIAPGLETGLNALCESAAQLPKVELRAPESVIGRDTESCMRSGALTGAASMIDGLAGRIEKEIGKSASLVMTGGLSAYVESLCEHPHVFDPYLLHRGLAYLYERAKI